LTNVMPAFNEEASLNAVISDLKLFAMQNGFKIIIVNDASIDNTKNIIDSNADTQTVKAIHHKLNKGYGGAIKTGILHANTDYVVTIDADGQHRKEDILKVYEAMKSFDADMVVGGRDNQKSSSRIRGFGKAIIRLFVRLMIKVPVKDINSGMKMYKTDIAKKMIRLAPNGMAFSDVITIGFVYFGYYVEEIPIKVNRRIAGKSTVNYYTAIETIREILFIAIIFVPYRFFTFLSLFVMLITFSWAVPFLILGKGVTNAAAIGFFLCIILWSLGIIAQLISGIRKDLLEFN
ncbi:MAG: glycosyltransferase family 2 protein, partial [Ferruginibacter sp.]|nr:glycosyltransferase family 2 protein [Ferruginibacter sp.]